MSHGTIKTIDFPEGGQGGFLSSLIVCLVQFVDFFFLIDSKLCHDDGSMRAPPQPSQLNGQTLAGEGFSLYLHLERLINVNPRLLSMS